MFLSFLLFLFELTFLPLDLTCHFEAELVTGGGCLNFEGLFVSAPFFKAKKIRFLYLSPSNQRGGLDRWWLNVITFVGCCRLMQRCVFHHFEALDHRCLLNSWALRLQATVDGHQITQVQLRLLLPFGLYSKISSN